MEQPKNNTNRVRTNHPRDDYSSVRTRISFPPAFYKLILLVAFLVIAAPKGSGFVVPFSSKTATKKPLFHSKSPTETTTPPPKKIPVHLLAGFLGSGKTTTLKHVLENKEDVRVGVIVNDVASVNIDAKLIAQRDASSLDLAAPSSEQRAVLEKSNCVVELQNGCACCSLAGELFDSIESLLPDTAAALAKYDAIVVELSGVADPLAIKNHWEEVVAKETHQRVTTFAELGRVVTVVDATTFGNDYMTFDVLKDRDGWMADAKKNARDHSGSRQVTYLLAEQVEAADLVVVNKQDLVGTETVAVVSSMAQSLNEDAEILVTSHGKISASKLLEMLSTTANAKADDTDETKHEEIFLSHSKDPSHSHSHDHEECDDIDCKDPSHSHSHDHEKSGHENPSHSHSHDHEKSGHEDPSHSHSHDHATCANVNCNDPSHSHSHDHSTCTDADCNDPSHSHSHDHSTCTDADCSDPSHSHSHDHVDSPTSTANLGISNFVYKASRPFHANRLMKLVLDWPVPIKDDLDAVLLRDSGMKMEPKNERENDGKEDSNSPFVGVLRSKGFCWIAPTAWEGLLADPWRHNRSMYWSHAGKHIGIEVGGPFWASLPRESMEEFFERTQNQKECQRILNEDFVTEEFGDRRQELVFIGVGIRQSNIEEALDDCLLTDEEMEEYRRELECITKRVSEAVAAAAATAE